MTNNVITTVNVIPTVLLYIYILCERISQRIYESTDYVNICGVFRDTSRPLQ